MFKRKLSALNFYNSDNFNADDKNEYRQLIAWLEDQKIRHYKIEDRENLRNLKSDKWEDAFKQYLSDVGCVLESNEKSFALDWLLNMALRLEMDDELENNPSKFDQPPPTNDSKLFKNPLDDIIDAQSEEFKSGVAELAKILKVPQHPNHLLTLEAISILLSKKSKESNVEVDTQKNISLIENTPLGFDTNDKVLNHAARVLRLLFINDVKELQTQINELIVAAQSITANPKTDSALGKVGK